MKTSNLDDKIESLGRRWEVWASRKGRPDRRAGWERGISLSVCPLGSRSISYLAHFGTPMTICISLQSFICLGLPPSLD